MSRIITFARREFEILDHTVNDDAVNPLISPEIELDWGHYRMIFEVHNKGANPLVDFAVMARPHKNSDLHIFYSGTDWDEQNFVMVNRGANNPQTLASGAKTFVLMQFGHVYSFAFTGECGAGLTTDLDIRGGYRV